MTVAAAAAKAGPYTGNDSASSFAFSFKVFADADIHVVKTVIASGAESDLVLNTDYTVTRNVDQDTNPGGSVVYKVGGVTTALPSTLKLTIVGDFDYAQPTDIPNGGSFFASVIETAFDRVTMLIKQLKERVDNALTLPVSVSGVSAELPTPEAMAVIGWNTDGDALVNYDAASLAGAVAAVDWIVDTFDGDGVETAFVLARDPGVAANCDISISGVTQVPGVDFTVSGTSLTFTTAPASGTDNICVRYGSALPSAASVPVDGVATASIQDSAVTTAKIADGAVTTPKIADGAVTQAKVDATYEATLVKSGTTKALTAGYSAVPYNAGTKSSGTFTPDEANGNFQYCVNGGAFTLAPPTNNCTLIIQITNNGSAGSITTSGFTKVTGTVPGTTNGDDFLAYVTKINGFSHLAWQAMQ